jgi:alcohol dehydrogenase, propanol-preferring
MLRMRSEQPGEIDTSPLLAIDVPPPVSRFGEVLIRVEVCAACHTDLHVVEGDLSRRLSPITPGHQVVGEIAAVRGVTDLTVGQRVGAFWLRSACGVCAYCQRGVENLCRSAEFNGYSAHGGYAEYMTAPGNFVVLIPDSISSEQAAPLLCGGAIGYRALRLSEARDGDRIGLYGFGASAHMVLQLARHRGMEVYVFTRSDEHRQLALKLGAAWAGGAEADPPPEIDAGIIFAPAGWIVPLALRALGPGGTLALAGIHMSPIPEMPYDLLYDERTVRSVANVTRQDAREVLDLAVNIPIRSEIAEYPLIEANRALQDLKHGSVNGAAVLRVHSESL